MTVRKGALQELTAKKDALQELTAKKGLLILQLMAKKGAQWRGCFAVNRTARLFSPSIPVKRIFLPSIVLGSDMAECPIYIRIRKPSQPGAEEPVLYRVKGGPALLH